MSTYGVLADRLNRAFARLAMKITEREEKPLPIDTDTGKPMTRQKAWLQSLTNEELAIVSTWSW